MCRVTLSRPFVFSFLSILPAHIVKLWKCVQTTYETIKIALCCWNLYPLVFSRTAYVRGLHVNKGFPFCVTRKPMLLPHCSATAIHTVFRHPLLHRRFTMYRITRYLGSRHYPALPGWRVWVEGFTGKISLRQSKKHNYVRG